MKTFLNKALLVLLAAGGMLFMPSRVLAETIKSVDIPVSVTVSGEDLPSPAEQFEVDITTTDGSPLPSETSLTLPGGETGTFSLQYDHVGVYTYQIAQKAGSLERATYDGTVYYLKVTVANADDGGYDLYAVAYKDAAMQGEKPNDIAFSNVYTAIPPDETETDPETETESETETEAETNKGSSSNKSESSTSIKTGDETPIIPFSVAAVISLLCVLLILERQRKKNKANN